MDGRAGGRSDTHPIGCQSISTPVRIIIITPLRKHTVTTMHSEICWLSDARLLLLCSLVVCGKRRSALKQLVFDLVSPVLRGAVVRLNRTKVAYDESFHARIVGVEFNEACIFVLRLEDGLSHDEDSVTSLHRILQQWMDRYHAMFPEEARPAGRHMFRDICFQYTPPGRDDADAAAAADATAPKRWCALRDLVPTEVRQGHATCVFWWLCELVPLSAVRRSSDNSIVSFLRIFFGGPPTATYGVSPGDVRDVMSSVWRMCDRTRDDYGGGTAYLYCCCCNAERKRAPHPVYQVSVVQLLHQSQVSSAAQDRSLTTRPPPIGGVDTSNWCTAVHRAAKPAVLPPPGHRRNKRRHGDISSSSSSGSGDSEGYDDTDTEAERVRVNMVNEHMEVEGEVAAPTAVSSNHALLMLPLPAVHHRRVILEPRRLLLSGRLKLRPSHAASATTDPTWTTNMTFNV